MKSLSVAYLIGRVVREPELRYTPDDQAVTTLSVATDRPGSKEDAGPDWHRCVLFGRLAQVANQYVGRGRLVYIAGRLTYRSWKDGDGHQRQVAEIIARELVLLDRRPDASPADAPSEQSDDTDLPF